MTEIRKLLNNAQKAQQLGVCTRTLKNWVAAGLLPPSTQINKRHYFDAAAMPTEQRRAGGKR
jgi:predicted site-specific integrase-resolvase